MRKLSIEKFAAATTVLALLPSTAWAQFPATADCLAYGPHMMGWRGGGGTMLFGPVLLIVLLALVVTAVVLTVRRGRAADNPPRQTPLDILRERFARSEIDKDEFEERRRVLGE